MDLYRLEAPQIARVPQVILRRPLANQASRLVFGHDHRVRRDANAAVILDSPGSHQGELSLLLHARHAGLRTRSSRDRPTNTSPRRSLGRRNRFVRLYPRCGGGSTLRTASRKSHGVRRSTFRTCSARYWRACRSRNRSSRTGHTARTYPTRFLSTHWGSGRVRRTSNSAIFHTRSARFLSTHWRVDRTPGFIDHVGTLLFLDLLVDLLFLLPIKRKSLCITGPSGLWFNRVGSR
jgi:hypothetical protein